MDRYKRYVRSTVTKAEADEVAFVDGLASQLRLHLESTAQELAVLHVHGASSAAVQKHVSLLLKDEIGFDEEVVVTPQTGFVTQARPDFFFELGEGRGVLAEVERGGTVTNNHDLKDLWKTHLAPDAQHLFLVVPVNNWKANGEPREKPFAATTRRLGAFFGDPRREVDVLSAHVFGY